MSVSMAMTVAQELADLTIELRPPERFEAGAPGTDVALDAMLAQREALIGRLGAVCSASMLASLAPDDRRCLIELLTRAEVTTQSLIGAAERVRDETLSSLQRTAPVRRDAAPVEPRFTERVA